MRGNLHPALIDSVMQGPAGERWEAHVGLRDFMNAVRARAWLVIVSAAIVTLTSVAVSFLQAPSYQGQATVLLNQQNLGTTLLGSRQPQVSDLGLQRDVQTQVDVMRSRGLLEQVIGTLGLKTTPTDLLEHVNVSADGQTNIVTIDVTDGSAARAADIANAIAEAYVGWSLDRERGSIKAAVDDVGTRLASAQERIAAIQATISSGDTSGARQVELQAANRLYGTLADQLEQLKMNEQLAVGSGSILASAAADPVTVSPNPVRNGALGLAMGLVLGLGMAFLAKSLDNTIKSSDQAEEIYGAPVLCSIPVEERKKRDAPSLTLLEHPGGSGAEAYRMLRNNLGFINFEHGIKTVLVTSAAPEEGKSTVAANLAIVLSRAGKRVVLVICDFHRAGATRFFDVDPTTGLSDVLGDTQDLRGALKQPTGFENLWVLPAGSVPPNPSELLGSSKMEQLLASLRESEDWVILDSAPLLAVADAAAVARWVDGVLIVTRVRVSTHDAARRSREQLANVGARIFGVALWGLEEAHRYGGYGGYGGYGSYSSDSDHASGPGG
jgi:capsular exopolysaccharide synthesis family protein